MSEQKKGIFSLVFRSISVPTQSMLDNLELPTNNAWPMPVSVKYDDADQVSDFFKLDLVYQNKETLKTSNNKAPGNSPFHCENDDGKIIINNF